MLRQNSQERFTPNHSATNSKSILTIRSNLSQFITLLSKQQHQALNDLSQKCSIMEYSLGSIQVLVAKISERLKDESEKKQSQMLSNLKIKQYQFIINELRTTVNKHSKKQEKLIQQLDSQKKRTQQFRDEIFKFEAKNNTLNEKLRQNDLLLAEKMQQIQHLTLSNHKYKLQSQAEDLIRSRFRLGQQNESKNRDCYEQLQSKLQELERDLQTQISMLQGKNKDLALQLKKLQVVYEESQFQSRAQKKQLEELNKSKYELQIKLKQQVSAYVELEQNYSKLLQKNNYNQIALHKQIQELKVKQMQFRNQFKKQKKSIRLLLSGIAEGINNGSKYYLAGASIKDQVQEIKKLNEKIVRKKNQQFSKEIESYQIQLKKMKAKQQITEQSLLELQKKERKDSGKVIQLMSEKSFEKHQSDRLDKQSEGGNSLVNKSTQKSEQDRYKNVEQKYKTKLQQLRKDLKSKQTRINQLQKQLQSEFDSSKQKILELELLVSEKVNQIRKSYTKIKEKDYEIQQLKSTLKQTDNKYALLAEKIQSEKEANSKLIESKTQNYEQKLKNIKNSLKELQKKEQEKTLKYNKLKSKYQKYEIQASESLKRKNAQIDQMLKQNTRLKIQNKLLQQKINLKMQNQLSVRNTNKETVNNSILEQIQAQRQRMNEEVKQKKIQISQFIQANSKMSTQNFTLKRELRQSKASIDELNRELKNLRDQNKNLKEKLDIVTQKYSQQNQQKHGYFKKQLQKALLQTKKLQKASQKYSTQKETLKKQIEELQSQLSNLKISHEKAKQKYSSISFELQNYKQQQKKRTGYYQIKLSQYATKEQQLVDIINYKNREGNSIRESMKGEELINQAKEIIIKLDKQTSIEGLILHKDVEINTEFKQQQKLLDEKIEKHIIPSQMFFDQQYQQQLYQKQSPLPVAKQNAKVVNSQVNYFNDLIQTQNLDDHFDICDEDEEINIGQTAINLQIKDVFNSLRKEIQKIFNEEDISIQMMKLLPKHLEDDFNQFMAYIKQKIYQIKRENNLSFIMVEAGSEAQSIEEQIVNFIKKQPIEYIKLRKIIEQKEIMISSLMNQRTEQQNTINQMTIEKEEMEEQSQNRFANQCKLYKKEIVVLGQKITILEMNCQSLKNIFKNTIQLWADDNDNQDDIKDNFVLYTNICKLNESDKRKLNQCLEKYRYSKMKS